MESLSEIYEWAVGFLATLNDQAAELDGRAAFALGLLAWFTVEQTIRRITGMLRVAIIVAAVGASGLGVASFLGAFDEGGALRNVTR